MIRVAFFFIFFLLLGCASIDESSSIPKSKIAFAWDFSKEKKIVYDFYQTTNVTDRRERDTLTDKHYFHAVGKLKVHAKNDSIANLSINSLEVISIDHYGGNQSPEDTTTQKFPNSVIGNMGSDGTFDDSGFDMTFGALFPIPNEPLNIGDSCEISMKFPFNANGSRLLIRGQNTMTFIGYEEMFGRVCAVLKGRIDVSQFDVPEELFGEYDASTTGSATYYFDLEGGLFIASDVHLVMKAFMDSRTEDEDFQGMFMDMINESTYKIRLKKIEE